MTLSDFGDSATNFAWDLGGGFDISLNSRMALRLFQVDYVGEKSTPVGTHFRAGAGVVFKF